MPPSAAQADAVSPDAGGSLDDASARLEAALARLEALVETGPFQSDMFRAQGSTEAGVSDEEGSTAQLGALRVELAAARTREQTLEAAAAAASDALGRAMVEVREVLQAHAAETPGGDGGAGHGLDLDAESPEDTRP